LITAIGELSLGDSIPGATAVGVAGVAGINGALPDIQARLDALLDFSPTPIDFNVQISLMQAAIVSAQAAITAGIVPPSIAAQIAEISAQIAALAAAIASVNVQLGIILDFQALLGAGGIFAYAYDGDVADLGDELDAEIGAGVGGGAPTDHCNAIVLLTSTPATWDAMGDVFQVTP
jgi:hypothetical protein